VLKRLAEATDPLYRSLDEAQKRRFAILTRAEGSRGWQRRGRDGGERGVPRGHHRTDATPADDVPTFGRKTVDGNVFAHTFVGKTVDGVLVGRVFGAKTIDGDLIVGEAAVLGGKTLEPIAFGGKFTTIEHGTFGPKVTSGEGVTFGRKITIGEPIPFGRKALTSI
jgi:hypothetical protein